MDRVYTGHVVPAEWRWVIFVSVTLLLIVFSPFLLIVVLNPPDQNWQFMGAIHDYQDAAASLARIRQGVEGQILVPFQHTPESNPAVLIHPIYPLLGQLARVTAISPILMFHLARIFSALFMYLTIYQLAANIWVKIRTRRIFFVIAVAGSGLGWIYAILSGFSGNITIPDLQLPMIYPLYSSAVNVHYPLTIACLSMVVSILIPVLRPGELSSPTVDNGGLTVFIAGLVLAFLFPDALLPIAISYVVSTIFHWRDQKATSRREFYWGLWILVPSLPIIAYDLTVLTNNPFLWSWVIQRGSQVPSILMLLLSIVIPLALAIPGFLRAFSRFEADGDRFMLVWLLAMIVVMYLPLPTGQYMLAGMMLPVAYFTTRSIEDFWFSYIRRRFRSRLYIVGLSFMALGHVVWLFLPMLPIVQGWSGVSTNVLNQGYAAAFSWLSEQVSSSDVVLTAPNVGIWIPFQTGARVVYGHPAETYQAEQKQIEVTGWYRAADSLECSTLLDRYHIAFVVYGPVERRIGAGECLDELLFIAQFGNVAVYATPYARLVPYQVN